MTKTGQIKIGKTPSVVTGEKSTVIEHGEPIKKGEKVVDPGLVKLAASLEED